MDLFEKALQIALKAYGGKQDKGGESYILHPLRVMMKMAGEEAKITALLHDAVEDSDLTLEELREAGFSEKIIQAIDCLTRMPEEDYLAFIERVATDPLAVKVKMADIEDNLNVLRLNSISAKDVDRIQRYHTAWRKLDVYRSRQPL